MMMQRKIKIRLHRDLHAQTTPYPDAGKWLKRSAIIICLLIIAGIIIFTRPNEQTVHENLGPKGILGEQDPPQNPETVDIYSVEAGDTLFNISQRFNVPWQKIAETNNLQEPYVLKLGKELKIPKK